MFQIALCEDEKIFAETQEQLCREILGRMNIECGITVFDSGKDFLVAFTDEGKRYDLILLDIVMPELSGIELARNIRETDRETDIVFITSSREHLVDGYGTHTPLPDKTRGCGQTRTIMALIALGIGLVGIAVWRNPGDVVMEYRI